jgi:hypothetical protein
MVAGFGGGREDVAPDGRRRDNVILVGMTGVMLAMTVLVYAPAEVPIVDDWTYAWSVEHFLHTGELRILEWSTVYPLAQILWGALFSRLLGFSFLVLRLSTLVLAWAGLLAFFLTLRELGLPRVLAGLGTLVLWCNPVFFVLSYSFMTDVPFVSVMNGAILFYVRWAKRGGLGDLSLGSGAALVAFLIRQPGMALALLPVETSSTHPGRICGIKPTHLRSHVACGPSSYTRHCFPGYYCLFTTFSPFLRLFDGLQA